ncbi:MAG: hypothetical protein JWO02_3936 [Solirubrobacterales bacterium]|nr:hypothetical protein [Solirubrobacterales bacterium]
MRAPPAPLLLRVPPWLIAATLALTWLAVAPNTPDLAAQAYRAGLFAREGFSVWDDFWYAGHHLPGYSLLFPPLGAIAGPRPVGVLTAIGSTVLFDRLATAHFGERARWGTRWFAAASIADLCIGRLTFSLGVCVGLAALLAWQRDHRRTAGLTAALCAAASPVAGAFLALSGAAVLLARAPRRLSRGSVGALWTDPQVRGAAAVTAGAGTMVAFLTVAFPEGGHQPFRAGAALVVVGCAIALVVVIDRHERTLRAGAALYAVAGTLSFVLATPMGSNVTRLGATFAGPLLVCACTARRPVGRRGRALLAIGVALWGWQWYAPAREMGISVGDPSTQASYYKPLIRRLEAEGPLTGRVEVPFTRAHWDAAHLAAHVPLARGWETQLDTKFNPLFQRATVSAAAYRAWLAHNAVRWVAVPDAPLDASGRGEAALIARGVPYLNEVWRNRHWRLYAVSNPTSLVAGPATLTRYDREGFTLRVRRPGRIVVRVHATRYWETSGAAACVTATPDDWTVVHARRRGVVRVHAALSARRLLTGPARCPT